MMVFKYNRCFNIICCNFKFKWSKVKIIIKKTERQTL